MKPRLTIGLTGGIASGKSAVGDEFARLGVPVIDADQIARDVVRPGQPALAEIRDTFGQNVIQADGALDRQRLRQIVFADEAARKKLDAIVHPRVGEELQRAREQATGDYVVLMVPLLIEAGMEALVDRVLVVDVPEEVQIERLRARDSVDEEQARRMIEAQASREQRLARADDVLRNTVPRNRLPDLVAKLHKAYLSLQRGETQHLAGQHLPALDE